MSTCCAFVVAIIFIKLKLTDVSVLVLGSLPQTIKTCLVSLMVTVTEVETSNIHTGLDQLLQLRHFPACRSECANDLGTTILYHGRHLNGIDCDVAAR